MSTMKSKAPWTADRLERLSDEKSYEIDGGKLVKRTMGVESSWIGSEILGIVREFCRANKLGRVFGMDNGFQCWTDDPTRFRRPDVSFVSFDRFPGDLPTRGFLTIAPDLAVEVISPGARAAKIARKRDQLLAAGVHLIWIVYPKKREVHVHRADRPVTVLGENAELSGEDVLPGFRCRISEFLPSKGG